MSYPIIRNSVLFPKSLVPFTYKTMIRLFSLVTFVGITLSLATPSHAQTGTWTITPVDSDDDVITGSHEVTEGDEARYTVTYSGAANDTVSITVTVDLVSAIAADFGPPLLNSDLLRGRITPEIVPTPVGSFIVIVNPDAAEEVISARVTVDIDRAGSTFSFRLPLRDDLIQEDEETFTVMIADADLSVDGSQTESVTTTIAANDQPPPVNAISLVQVTSSQVAEVDDAMVTYRIDYNGPALDADPADDVLVIVSITLTSTHVEDFLNTNGSALANADNFRTDLIERLKRGRGVNTDIEEDSRIVPPGTIGAAVIFTSTTTTPGRSSLTFSLELNNDDIPEDAESFRVEIAGGAVNPPFASVTTTIPRNDPLATVTIDAITPTTVSDAAANTVTYRLRYEGPALVSGASDDVTVTLSLFYETAEAADLFENTTEDLTANDRLDLSSELVIILTTAPEVIRVGTVMVDSASVTERPTVTITFTDTDEVLGIATAGIDFSLTVTMDTVVEGPETFRLQLSDGSSDFVRTTIVDSAGDAPDTTVRPNGTWSISSGDANQVEVTEGQSVPYTVIYTGRQAEVRHSVSITVQVDLGTADRNDFTNGLIASNLARLIGDSIATQVTNEPKEVAVEVTVPITSDGTARFSFSLPVRDDTDNSEGVEIFVVSLTGTTLAIDDDKSEVRTAIRSRRASPSFARWTISSSTTTVNEGQQASYTVDYIGSHLDVGETAAITVSVTLDIDDEPTLAEQEDFDPDLSSTSLASQITQANRASSAIVSVTAVLTPPPVLGARVVVLIPPSGKTRFSFSLPVLLDDIGDEVDETFTVQLTGAPTDRNNSVQTTIRPVPPLSGNWLINTANPNIQEGEGASYTVTYAGSVSEAELDASITVQVILPEGAGLADAADFDANGTAAGTPSLDSASLATLIRNAKGRTATAGTEITEISADVSVTITSDGTASFTFTLPIADDDDVSEPTEAFAVRISDPGPGTTTFTGSTNVVTRIETASPPLRWTISASPQAVSEGEAIAYTVTRSDRRAEGTIIVTVDVPNDVTDDDPAADRNDFTPLLADNSFENTIEPATGTLTTRVTPRGLRGVNIDVTLPAGSISFRFVLMIENDAIPEGAETFRIVLSATNAPTVILNQVTTTILPSDQVSVVGDWRFSTYDARVNEGEGAEYSIQYSGSIFEAGQDVSITVTIDLNAGGGFNTLPADFDTSTAPGQQDLNVDGLVALIIARGVPGTDVVTAAGIGARVTRTITSFGTASFSFSLPIRADTDSNGSTFTVAISGASGTTTLSDPDTPGGSTQTVTTTIVTDTTAWTISSDATTVTEGRSVRYTVSGPAGEGNGISLGIDLDSATSNDFNGGLDSARLVELIRSANTAENTTLVVTPRGGEIGVDVEVRSGRFVFSLPINNDGETENAEVFIVRLSAPLLSRQIARAKVTTTILPSDGTLTEANTPSGSWSFSIYDARVKEGEGAEYSIQYSGRVAEVGEEVEITVTVGLTGATVADFDASTAPGQQDLNVDRLVALIIAGGVPGTDVVATAVGIGATVTRTITSFGTASFSFSLPIRVDTFDSNDETFSVEISGASVGTTLSDPDTPGGATQTVTTTIVTDTTAWTISSGITNVSEGERVGYTVFGPTSGGSITVTVGLVSATVADFDADDPGTSPTVELLSSVRLAALIGAAIGRTVAPGGTGISAVVTLGPEAVMRGRARFSFSLLIADDEAVEEAEGFTITLSAQSVGEIARDRVTTTILPSGQNLRGSWTFSSASPSIIQERKHARYTITYTGFASEANRDTSIIVSVGLEGRGAADAKDFTPQLTSTSLMARIEERSETVDNPPPGKIQAMVFRTITAEGTAEIVFSLSIVDDDIEEGAETFTIELSNAAEGTSFERSSVTTTILASDLTSTPQTGGWTILSDATNNQVREGQTVLYTVTYRGTAAEATQLAFITVRISRNETEVEDFNPALTSNSLMSSVIGGQPRPVLGGEEDSGVILIVVGLPIIADGANGIAAFTFSLAIAADANFDEADESFTVFLTGDLARTTNFLTTTIVAPDGTWSIRDDYDTTVREGTGTNTVDYTITYSGSEAEQGARVSITLTLGSLGGNRQATIADFDADPSSPDTQEPLDDDSTPTNANYFGNRLSVASANVSSVTVVSTGPNQSASATVTLTIPRSGNVSFDLSLPIAMDNDNTEGDETFSVSLSGEGSTNLGTPTSVFTMILAPNGTWRLLADTTQLRGEDHVVRESITAMYTITYNGGIEEENERVSITVTVGDLGDTGEADIADFDADLNTGGRQDLDTTNFDDRLSVASANVSDVAVTSTGNEQSASATVTLTVPGTGTASFTFTLPIAMDDDNTEGDETFSVTLTIPSGDTTLISDPQQVTTRIVRVAGGMWAITQANEMVDEGESAVYTVTYTPPTNVDEVNLTVSIVVTLGDLGGIGQASLSDFDADTTDDPNVQQRLTNSNFASLFDPEEDVEDVDVILASSVQFARATVTLTVPSGGNASFMFTLRVFDDDGTSPAETFTVGLSAQTAGTSIPGTNPVTTTIPANDAAGTWTISAASNQREGESHVVRESESASYTITYTPASPTRATGQLVSITVTLGSLGSAGQAAIADFDADPNTDGPQLLNQTATSANYFGNRISGRTVSDVAVTSTGNEQSASATVTLTIPRSGNVSFDLSLPIAMDNDNTEGDETFSVTLTIPVTVPVQTATTGTPSSVTTMISFLWHIGGTRTVTEGEQASYTIFYNGTGVNTIRVTLGIVDPQTTEDFTFTNLSTHLSSQSESVVSVAAVAGQALQADVTFRESGAWIFSLTIAIDDTIENEMYTVQLLDPANIATIFSTAATTITDTPPGDVWILTSDADRVAEGSSIDYTITYHGRLESTIEVMFNPITSEEDDFTPDLTNDELEAILTSASQQNAVISVAASTRNVTFSEAGSLTFSLTLATDDTIENEMYSLQLNLDGAIVLNTTALTTTIVDEVSWRLEVLTTQGGDPIPERQAPVREGGTTYYRLTYSGGTLATGATISIDVQLIHGETNDFDLGGEELNTFTIVDQSGVTDSGDHDRLTITFTGQANNTNPFLFSILAAAEDPMNPDSDPETYSLQLLTTGTGDTVGEAIEVTIHSISTAMWIIQSAAQQEAAQPTAQTAAVARLTQNENELEVKEGEAFRYMIRYTGALLPNEIVSIKVVLNLDASGLTLQEDEQLADAEDFKEKTQPLQSGLQEAANERADVMTNPDDSGVRVTFNGQVSGTEIPPSLTFTLPLEEDDFEGNEIFRLQLSNPVPTTTMFTASMMVRIVEQSSLTAEVSKLVTPLILRAALPSLSDSVNAHVVSLFTNPTLPAPQIDEQHNFRLEVSTLINYQNEQQNPNDGQPDTQQRWSMWIDGRHTAVSAGHNVDVEGNVFNLWSGFDYRVTPDLIVGGLFGYERSDMDVSTSNDDSFDGTMGGDGFGGGSYVGIRLSENIIADASLVWMSLAYESSAQFDGKRRQANFTAGRLMITSNVTGNWSDDVWRITPRIRVMWTKEWQDSYADDAEVRVDQESFTFGRVSFGPEFAQHITINDIAWMEPFAGVEGHLEFDADVPAADVPGSDDNAYALDPNETSFGARLRFGVNGQLRHFNYRFEGTFDGIGQTSYNAWSGTAHLSYDMTEQLQLSLQNSYQGADNATITIGTTASYQWTESLRLSLENEYQPTSETSTVPLSVLGRVDWSF